MNDQKMIQFIIDGIIQTNICGQFDSVIASTVNEYPCIGLKLWNLDEADELLDRLPQGFYFIDLPFALIQDNVDMLRKILINNKHIQIQYLQEQIQEYINDFNQLKLIDNQYSLLYVMIWSVYSYPNIKKFLQIYSSQINLNDLTQLNQLFIQYYKSYKNNSINHLNTFNEINLDLIYNDENILIQDKSNNKLEDSLISIISNKILQYVQNIK